MTSVKSSADTSRFTFLRTLRKSWILPLGLFAVIMSQFMSIFSVISDYKYNLEHTRNFVPEDFMAQYKFVLMDKAATDYGFGSVLIQGALILVSVLLAVQIFKFVASKKMVNVYYSIGMTRANLFLSKYFAGAILLFAAISLPFTISVCANASFFGGCYELYISALGYWLNYLVVCFFCYNVTAIVLSCVGSVFEAGVYTGVLLIAPTIISYAIEKLMVVFLYGAPFGEIYNVVGSGSVRPAAFTNSAYINPLSTLFSGENTNGYSYILNDITDKTSFNWEAPDFRYAIIWGIVTLLLLAVGIAVFKRRKAEFSGFLGMCKPLTAICTFIVGLFASVYLIKNYVNASAAAVFIIGLITMLVAYSAAQLILFRSFKEYLKKIYRALFHYAVFAAFCLVFMTGLFGYSSKIPEVSEIESVAVSTATGNTLVSPGNSNIEYFYFNAEEKDTGAVKMMSGISLTNYSNVTFPGFKTEEEIEAVRRVHKMLISQKGLKLNEKTMTGDDYMQRAVNSPIVIEYKLANGKTVLRKYENTTYEVLAILSSLQNSDLYTEYAAKMIETGIYDENQDASSAQAMKSYANYSVFSDESNAIGLVSGNLMLKTELEGFEFGSENRNALLTAYCRDIRAGNGHLDLLTDKPPIGYIYYYYYNDNASFTAAKDNVTISKADDLDASFAVWNYNGRGLPVYADMTSTVAFLTENNLISVLSDSTVPVKASVCRLGDNGPFDEHAVDSSLNNNTSQIAGAVYYSTGARLIPADVNEYTKAADVAQIAANTLYTASIAQDGWYVALTYENGTVAVGFIPSQYLPAK